LVAKIKESSALINNSFSIIESDLESLTGMTTNVEGVTQDVLAIMDEAADTSENVTLVVSEARNAIESIAERASSGTAMASEINVRADEMMGDALESEKVAKEVGKIEELLASILAITSQTNLLALNASIEAARAREGKKGVAEIFNTTKAISRDTNEFLAIAEENIATAHELDEMVQVFKLKKQ